MILRSLKVERFAGLNPGAVVEKFGPDITVIHGPNGAGKSTLFRALTYALYQRHGLNSQEAVSQIVPRGRDVAPRVEVVFDVEGVTWRLTKQFVRKPDAELARLEGGVFVVDAQGAAAEDRLRDLLGSEKNLKGLAGAQYRGIGEILLVDQGDVRIGQVSSLARDRLRVVIDQVGTTQGAHELLAVAEKRYGEVFGKAGSVRESSDVAQLAAEIGQLDLRRDELRAQIARADELVVQLASLESESPEYAQEEIDRIDREIERARTRKFEAARIRAERDDLEKGARHASEEAERISSTCADLKTRRVARERLARAAAAAEARWIELNDAHQRAAEALRQAQDDLNHVLSQERLLSDRERATHDGRQALDLARRIPDLEDRVERHRKVSDEIAAIEQRMASRRRPGKADIARIREAFASLRDLERAAALLDFRVAVTAESGVSVECGAERIDLNQSESRDLVFGDGIELRVPGVVRIAIRAPGGMERARVHRDLDAARRVVHDIGLEFGAGDLEAIETLARERTDLDGALRSSIASRDAIFKDEAAAKAALSELGAARATLAELCERRPAWGGRPPDPASLAREEQSLEKERQFAGDAQSTRAKLLDARRENARAAIEALKQHDNELTALKVDLASCTSRIAMLEADGLSDADRARRLADLETSRLENQKRLAAANEALDALHDPDATIARLVTEKREREAGQKLTEERRIRLSEQLDQLRTKGLWKALADLEIEREEKAAALERARLDADALKLLRDVLVREQASAVEAAVRPVADRVTRMARFLFGSGWRATFGEQLAPQGLASDGGDMPVGLLSAGTQDQLALLTRIALGELYAEKCGRHAFVLDDPLVNSDRERRGRLLELLASSRSLQIVIFTCSPEIYRGLPAEKTVFLGMDDLKARLGAHAAMTA